MLLVMDSDPLLSVVRLKIKASETELKNILFFFTGYVSYTVL